MAFRKGRSDHGGSGTGTLLRTLGGVSTIIAHIDWKGILKKKKYRLHGIVPKESVRGKYDHNALRQEYDPCSQHEVFCIINLYGPVFFGNILPRQPLVFSLKIS